MIAPPLSFPLQPITNEVEGLIVLLLCRLTVKFNGLSAQKRHLSVSDDSEQNQTQTLSVKL